MLSAINNENKYVMSFFLSEEEIKNCDFFCPCCKESVFIRKGRKKLKSGELMVTHFYHSKDSDCPSPKESTEHLLTKISIFNSLKNSGIQQVWLERTISLNKSKKALDFYLKEVNSNYSKLNIHETFFGRLLERNLFRPDVCFTYNNENIAIEIQKSYLPREDFLLRTLFYKILNIKVLWIIPDEVFIKKIKVVNYELQMNISDFHKELKKYYYSKIYCWDYKKSILNVYKIENITGYKTIGSMVEGEYGGTYFSQSGGYKFIYKKLKKIEKIYSQDNILNGFKSELIPLNYKYRMLIDANVWLLKI